ncbi:MAG: Peptide deformylase [Candidatus Woesebacteria bacterium GW2011_GWA1_39_8]|uniref:Peptide deformylase n=2 Tax=Candidatus Woeseibacteriota TaxID=1752722 RepID=A0A0G0SXS8_9BACT|nr:MAG: Peptide deformylase [Candidatus Woesebacteria bacterium GW2011_GWA1_39_8]
MLRPDVNLLNWVCNDIIAVMIRDIVNAKDPRLRVTSKPVNKIDKKIREIINDLKETLVVQNDPEGIGLAAPQIGKNVRVFVMKPDEEITTVINPKILKIYDSSPHGSFKKKSNKGKPAKKDKKIMEGCLSLPHFYGPIRRAKKVTIEYLEENGVKKNKTFEGLEAQIVLHEIDHLDGKLFIDRLIEQKKPLFEYKDGEWEEVDLI